jgi:hypothetical protein
MAAEEWGVPACCARLLMAASPRRSAAAEARLLPGCPPSPPPRRVHFFFTYIFIGWVCWLLVQYYKARGGQGERQEGLLTGEASLLRQAGAHPVDVVRVV